MISKQRFCVMYRGMPIEGISSSSGYPIFSVHDKTMPDMSFTSYEGALSSIAYMTIDSLRTADRPEFDVNDLTVGAIEIVMREMITPMKPYDMAFQTLALATYMDISQLESIIHTCVRRGFKTVLPKMHTILLSESRFTEHLEKNVPFFVQQNIERFMDEGINTCTDEEIGAIILTSSDELLKAIHIDSLNNVSK